MTDRIMVATPITLSKLYVWDEWVESIRAQDIKVPFDLLLIDNTDFPPKEYLEWLRAWVKSKPFGEGHKIRLKRFGYDVDGEMFFSPIYKVAVSDRALWEYFARWKSYTHLLSLECDVLMPPDGMRTLYEAQMPWAAAWMLSRHDLDHPGNSGRIPLLWHGLDLPHWQQTKSWDELLKLGWMTPPSEEPFPCVVTHLGCTLIAGDVIRTVPFRLTSAGGDVQYSWDAAAAGVQPMCIPSVACDHVSESERPDHHPAYSPTEV